LEEIIVRRLVELNSAFYKEFAASFSASRASPQPGYSRLLEYIPSDKADILDVGCGNGRFGRLLVKRRLPFTYTGVDFNESFLGLSETFPGQFLCRDLSLRDCLSDLSQFDLIVCLSTLQHIPGRTNRERLVREMGQHLRPDCFLALANWQFLDSPRQRRKIRPWSIIDLDPVDTEAGDYLLSWERGGIGLRYVAYLDAGSIEELAGASGLRVVMQFRSDGREGNLNLYSILTG
jgi:2-polyprenyl-3-methyl-5-hydroxy-6-metoxy-1,4-benzoquinol methylase